MRPCVLFGLVLGQRGAKIAECPLLGERSSLEEDDRDLRGSASGRGRAGPAGSQPGRRRASGGCRSGLRPRARRAAARRAWPARRRACRCSRLPARSASDFRSTAATGVPAPTDRVVAGNKRGSRRWSLLLRETVRVALAGVDDDQELGEAAHPPARDAGTRSRRGDDLARLPEDALPAGRQGSEHELRAVLAGPVEDQIDRDAVRRQARTGTSSTISGSEARASTRAQKTRLVRGHVSPASSTRPPPSGSRTRYGSRQSGSGLRATTKLTPTAYGSQRQRGWPLFSSVRWMTSPSPRWIIRLWLTLSMSVCALNISQTSRRSRNAAARGPRTRPGRTPGASDRRAVVADGGDRAKSSVADLLEARRGGSGRAPRADERRDAAEQPAPTITPHNVQPSRLPRPLCRLGIVLFVGLAACWAGPRLASA